MAEERVVIEGGYFTCTSALYCDYSYILYDNYQPGKPSRQLCKYIIGNDVLG